MVSSIASTFALAFAAAEYEEIAYQITFTPVINENLFIFVLYEDLHLAFLDDMEISGSRPALILNGMSLSDKIPW